MRPKELECRLGTDRGAGLEASPSREQINNGLLANQELELYWLKDRLEVYIVHVQGSAKLTLPNGEERSVGYAGKTELPYRGLGQSLVEEGELDRQIRRYPLPAYLLRPSTSSCWNRN